MELDPSDLAADEWRRALAGWAGMLVGYQLLAADRQKEWGLGVSRVVSPAMSGIKVARILSDGGRV